MKFILKEHSTEIWCKQTMVNSRKVQRTEEQGLFLWRKGVGRDYFQEFRVRQFLIGLAWQFLTG